MRHPVIIGVYGTSNTGKTTLIEKIIKQLSKEGYTVATIKKTEKHICLDTPGKDTWRHHKAGATLIIFSSAIETDFLVKTHIKTAEIIPIISEFGTYDLILVEGADDPQIPKIQVSTGHKRDNTIACFDSNFNRILNMIKKEFKKQHPRPLLQISVNGKRIYGVEERFVCFINANAFGERY